MHLKILLLIVLTIALVGIAQLGTVDAAIHTFESEWGQSGIFKPGSFLSPQHLAFDSENNVYITDLGNARIQKFTFDGEYVSHFGQSGKRGGNFITPVDIVINSDKIYVTDSNLNKIIIFDIEGNYKNTFNDTVGGYAIYPEGISLDSEGNIYVADYRNNRIIQ